MLGTELLLISLAAYASGQGLTYYGTSNVRNQSRPPPRRPLNSFRSPTYTPPPNPPQPVYQPPGRVYQPPKPVYQPPRPNYSYLPITETAALTEPSTTQIPINSPGFRRPPRPLYSPPLTPPRPLRPMLSNVIELTTPAPVNELSTTKTVEVVYSEPPSYSRLNLPASSSTEPTPVEKPVETLTPEAKPDQTLPTTSNEPTPKPSPELIPITEPVPNPQPSPAVQPEPLPVPQPNPDPGLFTPSPALTLPTATQDARPTVPPTPETFIPPTSAPIAPVGQEVIQPILPVRPPPTTQLEGFQCTRGTAYYTIKNNCDAYIECQNQRAYSRTCPDGLHFNPEAVYPRFPCAYPSEVKCDSAASKQQAQPTAQCPRRYGFFPLSEGDCSQYITCQDGNATLMNCPIGLVFNDQLSSCDWPENVPQCSLRAFKDFTCPTPPIDDDADLIYKYRYGTDCKLYVACQRGHPRLLKCDPGMSFDENSQMCKDSDLVINCGAITRY